METEEDRFDEGEGSTGRLPFIVIVDGVRRLQ